MSNFRGKILTAAYRYLSAPAGLPILFSAACAFRLCKHLFHFSSPSRGKLGRGQTKQQHGSYKVHASFQRRWHLAGNSPRSGFLLLNNALLLRAFFERAGRLGRFAAEARASSFTCRHPQACQYRPEEAEKRSQDKVKTFLLSPSEQSNRPGPVKTDTAQNGCRCIRNKSDQQPLPLRPLPEFVPHPLLRCIPPHCHKIHG